MKQLVTKLFLLLFLFLTLSCGFKVINESEKNNFFIKQVNVSGDKRVNFKIKNNLLTYSTKDHQNVLIINLVTKKHKNVKEKNIKNEITKYQISLNVNVKFNVMNNDEDFMISISSGGDYLVNESYSTTLNNEKKLIDDLVENISEKIVKKISLKLDDI